MSKSIAKKALDECRKILNATRSDTFYDLRMTAAERGVLLRAARLPDSDFYRNRKFSSWNDTDKNKIKQAAKKAGFWANGLEIGGGVVA